MSRATIRPGDESGDDCRCPECAGIHAEFIGAFGKWPSMSHDEGQDLVARRWDNLRSWDRARLGTLSGEYDRGDEVVD